MTALASISDVEGALGRELDDEESLTVPGLLDEASDLVEGYLGGVDSPVPGAVKRVVARMVVRVLAQSAGGAPVGLSQMNVSAGPFSSQRTFRDGATSGAPWLENTDKTKLKRYRRGGGMISVSLSGEQTGYTNDFRSW